MCRLPENLDPAPAHIANARGDLLAWNPMGAALFGALFRDSRPNYRNVMEYAVLDRAHRRTHWTCWR